MLTAQEKTAGRFFRDEAHAELQRSLRENPPTHLVPIIAPTVLRHSCRHRDGRSTALLLAERYIYSPAYPEYGVPKGRFGYIYRAGTCRGCGDTARSKEGRLVDGWARPPLAGRVART